MSGPKTSRYRMTEEQRRQLQEQQRIINDIIKGKIRQKIFWAE